MLHVPCSEFGPEVITDEVKIQMPCFATNLCQMRGGGKGFVLGVGLVIERRFASRMPTLTTMMPS
jgi:hypothetical protein